MEVYKIQVPAHAFSRPKILITTIITITINTIQHLSTLFQYEILHRLCHSFCPGHRRHALVNCEDHPVQQWGDHVCSPIIQAPNLLNHSITHFTHIDQPSLRIQVAGASSPRLGHFAKPKGSIDPKHYPICLAVCWSDENRCPEGWVSILKS